MNKIAKIVFLSLSIMLVNLAVLTMPCQASDLRWIVSTDIIRYEINADYVLHINDHELMFALHTYQPLNGRESESLIKVNTADKIFYYVSTFTYYPDGSKYFDNQPDKPSFYKPGSPIDRAVWYITKNLPEDRCPSPPQQ